MNQVNPRWIAGSVLAVCGVSLLLLAAFDYWMGWRQISPLIPLLGFLMAAGGAVMLRRARAED